MGPLLDTLDVTWTKRIGLDELVILVINPILSSKLIIGICISSHGEGEGERERERGGEGEGEGEG